MAYQFNGFRATRPVVRLIDSKESIYEVFFLVYDDSSGKKHQMRYKTGINNLPRSQRKPQAHANADVLWEELQMGWNPLIHKYPPARTKPADQKKKMSFHEGLTLAVEFKRRYLSKFSMYDYDGCVKFICEAAKKTGNYYEPIDSLQKRDVRAILSQAKEMYSWSNNSRNKHLGIFRSLLSVLSDEEEIIPFNPAKGIKDEPVEKGAGYKRLTDEEKDSVAEWLLEKAPEFLEYLMFIYDDGTRRKETLLLQIRDFNLTTREIHIRPEVAKTNAARIIPITDTLMQILISREIWKYPPDYYLFSNDKFKPGPRPYHPNVPTEWWRNLVIDKKKGLGINCKMYSLKHKGADDKILADIPIDVLRTLYGHKSQQMTEIYARAIKGKYKQQVIEKAPVFAKVINLSKRAK